MNTQTTFQTRAVLAASYKGRAEERGLRTHVAEVHADGTTLRVLCGNVKVSNLADESATEADVPATCPRCAQRDPRAKTFKALDAVINEVEPRPIADVIAALDANATPAPEAPKKARPPRVARVAANGAKVVPPSKTPERKKARRIIRNYLRASIYLHAAEVARDDDSAAYFAELVARLTPQLDKAL